MLAWGLGATPVKGKPSGMRGAFRFLFRDTMRIKVGNDSCDLRAILECLKQIEDSLPTKAGITFELPFMPVRTGSNGQKEYLNSCPISTRPPTGP